MIEVTKSKPTEVMTRVDAHGRLYKNLESGKIILEVYVDGTLFHDECLQDTDDRRDGGWVNWANKELEKVSQ